MNGVTMYRLTIYYLVFLFISSILLSYFKFLPFEPFKLTFSAFFITVISWMTNELFSLVFKAPSNKESTLITALIVFLIIEPAANFFDKEFIEVAFWASVWAVASKYILALKNKHFFNPAAFGVALTSLTINQSANWWVGTDVMLPLVVLGGVLVVKRIARFDVVISFLLVSLAGLIASKFGDVTPFETVKKAFFNTPLAYFSLIMLTEPLTSPTSSKMRTVYGAMVGFLFVPSFHLGTFYFTPELALLAGNVFSYLVISKNKLMLELKEIVPIAKDAYDFVFVSDDCLYFKPGQYLEWTLPHKQPDRRGVRRYFTLSSSPTEDEIKVGIKIPENPSTFKQHLLKMKKGDLMFATHLSGDFVLPKNKEKKLVFMAGGIGITPFRSMIKYLLDRNEIRNIILIYSGKTINDFAYISDLLQAKNDIGLKIIFNITDQTQVPQQWKGEVGHVSENKIIKHIPDYGGRIFYISGPTSMVSAFEYSLRRIGISKKRIIKDYFPGF